MGDCSPGAYLERVQRSKKKYLGIKAFGLTKKERENREELHSRAYKLGGEQIKNEIRARAFSKDLWRFF